MRSLLCRILAVVSACCSCQKDSSPPPLPPESSSGLPNADEDLGIEPGPPPMEEVARMGPEPAWDIVSRIDIGDMVTACTTEFCGFDHAMLCLSTPVQCTTEVGDEVQWWVEVFEVHQQAATACKYYFHRH